MSPVPSYIKRLLSIIALCVAATLATPDFLTAQEDTALWYETETINSGLEAPSKDVDRSSPRAALRSFLELIEKGDLSAALHLMNLSEIPKEEQQALGSQLVSELASIFDRKLRINWSSIPADPSARTTDRAEGQALSEPRRDYFLEDLDVDGQVYAIRLSRYAAQSPDGEFGDPVWLFSRETVDNIDVLYDAFGPRAFESHIPGALKARFGWLNLWEWIALPLLLGAVVCVGMLTSKLVGLGKYISNRRVLSHAFERASLPLSLVTASIAAYWLLGFIVSLSGPVIAVITPALVMLSVVGFSLAALRGIDALIDHVTRRYLGDDYDAPSSSEREFHTSMYAIRRIILVATVGFSLVFVLMQFDILADMGLTLIASAGVLTVILGIAGQTTLGNIVASLQIAIAKPVRIGDSIQYEGDWCIVESIYFTFIRLRTWDERRIIVPVKYFLSYPFKNWSVVNERMLCTIQLVLDPMAEVAVLREKFEAIAKSDPNVIEHDEVVTYVTCHSSNGMTVEFFAMAPDPSTARVIEMRLREKLVDFVRREHPEWWWRERFVESRK
ncbi:mechanosensitive ion channel family protein [Sulfitobacter guttiformis]|uniref:mechanosensitive ion channel family protein n=1 Tax=Sulfitobacter guttiformis TaxID=74349 RepID=UPI000468CB1D|nr:mechanosensitive ion channel domain-containing protein [Sulfitobacter guttiformis]KIN71460.1 Mechanosensitive ion channel protein MscS [Sulfitobacter guttiformis KCTC 32187]